MPQQLPTPDSRGKVRDLYDLGDRLLLVASDRLSAFDVVLPDPIPYKGEVLTKLSLFWFELLGDVVPNHLLSVDVADLPEQFAPAADYLRGRFMLVKKAKVFPVECIVRGYLAGSGWAEYQRAGTVCGIPLAAGLVESDRLPEPIFTPSTKAEIGLHDENMSFERMVEIIGTEAAEELRTKSLAVYSAARDHAASPWHHHRRHQVRVWHDRRADHAGRRSADARFEPLLARGELRARKRAAELRQAVRSRLADRRAAGTRIPPAPALPPEVIEQTSKMYIQAYELVTGRAFVPEG